MSDRTVCVLPAAHLAAAWLNVYQAAGQNEDQPALYRSVCVEIIDASTVRLVATDSYIVLTSAVREGMATVTPDEAAVETIVAIDEDQRAQSLFKFVAKDAKAKQDVDAGVRLSVGSIESDDAPTLMPSLARRGLSIEYGAERLVLPINEVPFPDWRPMLVGREPCATETVSWSPWVISRLASMRSSWDAEIASGVITVEHAGPLGAAAVTVAVWPEVTGLVMPVRVGVE